MAVDIPALVAQNATRWTKMKLDPVREPQIMATAKKLCAPENKVRFQAVTAKLVSLGYQPMPWAFVAIVAEREYGGPPIWNKQLGQGDPLNEVSHNDPAGRGPFLDHPGDGPTNNAWLRCALDALIDCQPKAALWNDWTGGGFATISEEYNGLGYAAMGVPSAYVWSGSDQYVSGKYVADHVYRAGVKDVQLGCMPLLDCMMSVDKSIILAQKAGAVKPAPTSPVAPAPASISPPPQGLVDHLLDAFHRL